MPSTGNDVILAALRDYTMVPEEFAEETRRRLVVVEILATNPLMTRSEAEATYREVRRLARRGT